MFDCNIRRTAGEKKSERRRTENDQKGMLERAEGTITLSFRFLIKRTHTKHKRTNNFGELLGRNGSGVMTFSSLD